MAKIGIIGLGMMGTTHLDAYQKTDGATVVAIADKTPALLSGEAAASGNIEGQAAGGVASLGDDVKRYSEGVDLINDPNVEVVDICLPTPLHTEYALAAMAAGKHVLLEKPMARTAADCQTILAAAKAKPELITMPAMCMRFWPGWDWLKTAVDEGRYGKVISATFRRIASLPPGGFYANAEASGGAILDLHIHDTDFVQYLFGMPSEVTSFGSSSVTGGIDHVVTRYTCDNGALIVAEGSWAMADGFGFQMQYQVNFENATAVFDLAAEKVLTLIEKGKEPVGIELDSAMGYDLEIEYFVKCLEAGEQPTQVTMQDAADTVRIIEAEMKSIETGQPVKL